MPGSIQTREIGISGNLGNGMTYDLNRGCSSPARVSHRVSLSWPVEANAPSFCVSVFFFSDKMGVTVNILLGFCKKQMKSQAVSFLQLTNGKGSLSPH